MPLCDTLLRAAEAEFYRPYFSQEILDEVTRNLVKQEKMKDVLGRLSRQVPNFAGKILCQEYGNDVAKIARNTLNKAGQTLGDGEQIYEGKQYCLRQKQGTLTIIDKRGRGEILKSERGKLEGNLSLDDIDKFQDVGQIL